MLMGSWCHILSESPRGITYVFHAFRVGKMHILLKANIDFRLNYGNAAKQSMFANKLGT